MAFAQNVTIGGINYELSSGNGGNGNYGAKILPSSDAEGYKGNITIPKTITYGRNYSVGDLDPSTFVNNKNLTSVSMPYICGNYSLTELFKGCCNLTSLFFTDYYGYTIYSNVLYRYIYGAKTYSLDFYPAGLKDKEYNVISNCFAVTYNAFSGCKYIEKINIGDKVTSICGFEGCDNLESLNVSSSNNYLCSIDGIVYDKQITTLKAYPTGKKGTFNIPESVNNIDSYALAFCNFSELLIPATVEKINSTAFYKSKINTLYIKGQFSDYKFLQNLDASSVVYVNGKDYTLAKQYFNGIIKTYETFWVEKQTETMLGKATFTLPKYSWIYGPTISTNLGSGVIYNGYKIKTVAVNDKIIEPNTDGSYTADNLLPGKEYKVKLDWDRYSRKDVIAESGTDYDIITTKKAEFTAIQSGSSDYYDWNNDKEGRYYISYHTDSLPAHVTASSDESLSPSVVGYYIKELKEYKKADEKGLVVVKDLYPATMLTFLPYAIYRGVRYEDESKQFRFKTPDPTCNVETSCTQTTVTIKSIAVVDYRNNKNTNPTSIRFTIDGKEYSWTGKPITIKGLYPNRYYGVSGSATYGENHNVNISFNFQTESFHPSIYKISAGPTSIHVKGTYSLGDSKLEKAFFSDHDGEGDDIVVTGLKPNTKYSFKYWVKASGTSEYATLDVTTAKITLESQNPKVLGNNSAIVCAKTNIENEEKGAGFEWRKTDAPDVVVSKSGSGVVYGGMLEGRINNLSTSSYYKVRPFYKASDGTMYYGEWIGFDPSDFSYFDPTVHTYARVSVQSTSAKVKGVALQGTDDITEQGFEYWAENAIASRAAGDKQIIQATGQSMEAEITDLAPNTTYNYRAYAKTSKGTTYGETLKFTTPVATAIIGITNTTNSDLQFNVRNTNNVQIAINGTDKECNYRMNSITGANIASGKTTADGEWHTIANYQLPSGIYIITVSDGKDKKSTKIAIK